MSSSQSRHVYTREQRTILEASFARQSHPDINEKERLAKSFNCNLIQISNWFQNHRRRVRKQTKLISANIPSTSYVNAPSYQTYIPHQPDCPYIANNENVSYYYYYPSSQYSYPQQPYDQTMSFATYYEQ